MHFTLKAQTGKKDDQKVVSLKDLTLTDLDIGLRP